MRVDESVVSASAPSGLRSRSNRFNSSAEKCCASAADPPFPQAIILFLDWSVFVINSIAAVRGAVRTGNASCFIFILLKKCEFILA